GKGRRAGAAGAGGGAEEPAVAGPETAVDRVVEEAGRARVLRGVGARAARAGGVGEDRQPRGGGNAGGARVRGGERSAHAGRQSSPGAAEAEVARAPTRRAATVVPRKGHPAALTAGFRVGGPTARRGRLGVILC